MAIGEGFDTNGMVNVLRIYNDPVGVELVSRTGLNPRNSYVHVGCSKAGEVRMLTFARDVVGRPFSNAGMFRSILWPRTTDNKTFFCAELVAACLREGGLLSTSVNPGAATPASLYKLFKASGACTGNPLVLQRAQQCQRNERLRNGTERPRNAEEAQRLCESLARASMASAQQTHGRVGNMHVVSGRMPDNTHREIQITLNSLDMRKGRQRR